jgi:hypothetical protein
MMTCYDDAMRTIVDLPDRQLEALDGICRRESISRAEAIRRAVDLLVHDRAAGAAEAAFGLWRGRQAIDGLQYQDQLRREWSASSGRATGVRRHRSSSRPR